MKFTVRAKLIALSIFLVTFIMVHVTYFSTIREVDSKRSAVEHQMERIARNIATMQLVERQNWNDYQDYISRLMAVNEDYFLILAVATNGNSGLARYQLRKSVLRLVKELS